MYKETRFKNMRQTIAFEYFPEHKEYTNHKL